MSSRAVGNNTMMLRLRDETSANTPRFSYPYGTMIFIAAIPIGFQIANQKTRKRSGLVRALIG
jgi:hypothetical protein